MSYNMQGGYGQTNLRPGMSVQTDTGWGGQIVEVIPAQPGYDSMVRVAWHGYGTTDVAAATFVVENGVAWIRAQPPAQPEPQQQQQQPAPQPAPQFGADEEEMATQLAAPARPARQEPTHVNPYATDPPLVTSEPAPVHASGQQPDTQHVSPYLADEPVVASEPPPVPPLGGGQMDPDATILPSGARGQATDPDATVLPTSRRSTAPAYGASDETILSQPATPRAAPMPEPDAAPVAATTPLAIPAEQREIVVPIIEEQVTARAEWRDAGAINVRKVTDEEPVTLMQETQRDEVFVDRVAVGRVLDEGEEVAPREEGGVYIVPVVVEEAVVVTRRVLVEELRLTKRSVATMQTLQTVVRKERVEIDGGALADRIHDGDGADTDAANVPFQTPRGNTPV